MDGVVTRCVHLELTVAVHGLDDQAGPFGEHVEHLVAGGDDGVGRRSTRNESAARIEAHFRLLGGERSGVRHARGRDVHGVVLHLAQGEVGTGTLVDERAHAHPHPGGTGRSVGRHSDGPVHLAEARSLEYQFISGEHAILVPIHPHAVAPLQEEETVTVQRDGGRRARGDGGGQRCEVPVAVVVARGVVDASELHTLDVERVARSTVTGTVGLGTDRGGRQQKGGRHGRSTRSPCSARRLTRGRGLLHDRGVGWVPAGRQMFMVF